MAIALNPSTPAALHQGAGTSGRAITAAFSPPAGSLVLIAVTWMFGSYQGAVSFTVTDSNGVSYQQLAALGATYDGDASALFCHYYAAAPGAITVTSQAGSGAYASVHVVTQVLTGASATQPGGTFASGAESDADLTSQQYGSWLYACGGYGAGDVVPAAMNNTLIVDSYANEDTESTSSVGRLNGAVGTPGAIEIGWGRGVNEVCAAEILSAAGGTTGGGGGGAGGELGPSWSFQQVLTADAVNTWLTPYSEFATADVSRASTTILAADPELSFPVAAGGIYAVRMGVTYGGQGFFAWTFTGIPAGAYMAYNAAYENNNDTTVIQARLGSDTGIYAYTNGSPLYPLFIDGQIQVGSTPGTITFSWAQAVSNSTAVTRKRGSYLMAWRLA